MQAGQPSKTESGMKCAALTDMVSAEVAAHVRDLMLFARSRVEGRRPGDNRSVLRAFSTDFLQHRQYYPGDNLKYLDWKVWARTNRYVVREYEETTNLDLYLAVDVSASMSFAGCSISKHTCAVRAAAVILYLVLLQNDSFGLSLFSDRLLHHCEPMSGRRHLIAVYERLVACEPEGTADWSGSLRQIQSRISRRGLVVVISDFIGEPEEIGRGLSAFRSLSCDVIVLHVVHPEERSMASSTVTRFVDMEDGSSETVDPLLVGEAYARRFAAHCDAVRDICARRAIGYARLVAGEDEYKAIGAFLRRRSALLL